MKKHILWGLIALAIGFNHWFRFSMEQSNGSMLFHALPIIGGIRYSEFLTQKWFLVIASFFVFGFWLRQQKDIVKIFKENILFILTIAAVSVVVHYFSFQRWFEFDDYRVIGHHNAVTGTSEENTMGLSNSTSYAIGMVYLVVRWFGTNFALYDSLGVFFYFLTGIIVFAFLVKVQKNKTVALLASLFFITSPTYWRQTLQMQEFIGDGFSILLFALTNLQLFFGFYPGAILSAAATLEFGLSRTHFISAPLFLATFLLAQKNTGNKIGWWLALFGFPLLSLFYLPVFMNAFPESVDQENLLSNFRHVLRVFDSVFAVTVPHWLAFQAIWFFRWLFETREHISYILGGTIVMSLLLLSTFLFQKKNLLAGKLVFLGVVIVVAAITLPTLSGIRIIQNLKDLTIQYDDIFPTAPTSYGVFSTFGVIFILAGLGQVVKQILFRNIMIILILLNLLTVVKSDIAWVRQYSLPERTVNMQLERIISADGEVKVIYTPPPTQILARYVDFFYQLYRIKEPLYIQNEPEAFIDLLKKYNPQSENIYVLGMDHKTYKITDLSSRVRSYPVEKLTLEWLNETLKQ